MHAFLLYVGVWGTWYVKQEEIHILKITFMINTLKRIQNAKDTNIFKKA